VSGDDGGSVLWTVGVNVGSYCPVTDPVTRRLTERLMGLMGCLMSGVSPAHGLGDLMPHVPSGVRPGSSSLVGDVCGLVSPSNRVTSYLADLMGLMCLVNLVSGMLEGSAWAVMPTVTLTMSLAMLGAGIMGASGHAANVARLGRPTLLLCEVFPDGLRGRHALSDEHMMTACQRDPTTGAGIGGVIVDQQDGVLYLVITSGLGAFLHAAEVGRAEGWGLGPELTHAGSGRTTRALLTRRVHALADHAMLEVHLRVELIRLHLGVLMLLGTRGCRRLSPADHGWHSHRGLCHVGFLGGVQNLVGLDLLHVVKLGHVMLGRND
jgi:hypothetical protein